MTPEQRAELESRAARALRRGELSEALVLLEAVRRAFPADAALAGRLEDLRASAQPEELRAAAPPASAAARPARPTLQPAPTPEQEGERLYHLGDYVGAAAAYRRALRERPDSELIRERLEEIVLLAQSAPRHSPTDAALPTDSEARLRALLDRIAARKRIHT